MFIITNNANMSVVAKSFLKKLYLFATFRILPASNILYVHKHEI